MKRIQSIVLLVVFGLLFVPTVMARGMGPEGKLKALDLTADQQQRVDKLLVGLMERIAPVKAQLDVKRAENHALWMTQEPDKKAILAKQAEMETLRQKIREARVDFRLDVLRVLKPEQRAKFLSFAGSGMGKGMGCSGGCGHMGGHGSRHGDGGFRGQGQSACPFQNK